MNSTALTCQGCDQPILFGTYCPKCAEEIDSLLAARPFEFPQWAKAIGRGFLWAAVIMLVFFCFYQGCVDFANEIVP